LASDPYNLSQKGVCRKANKNTPENQFWSILKNKILFAIFHKIFNRTVVTFFFRSSKITSRQFLIFPMIGNAFAATPLALASFISAGAIF